MLFDSESGTPRVSDEGDASPPVRLVPPIVEPPLWVVLLPWVMPVEEPAAAPEVPDWPGNGVPGFWLPWLCEPAFSVGLGEPTGGVVEL